MKNKTRILLLLILSLVMTGILYFMTYNFNVRFTSLRSIKYVNDFRQEGGLTLIATLIALLVLFTIIFISYIVKDTNQLEIFGQSGNPEYYKKNNLFSVVRLFQYYVIMSGYFLLIRDGYRAYTFSGSTMSMYIFKTDVLFVMWDVILWLFVGLTITLFIEYLKSLKTIEH